MPGDRPLPIAETSDMDAFCVSLNYGAAADWVDSHVFYCEKDTWVDAAYLTLTTAVTSASSTVDLVQCAAGTAPSAGTTLLTAALDTDAITVDTGTAFSISATANRVPAGSTIAINVTNAAGLAGANLYLRLRTKVR